MRFKINKTVIEKFPDLLIYIPVIKNLENTTPDYEKIKSLLKQSEENIRSEFNSFDEFINNSRAKLYLDTFEKFGANTKKKLPTHLALARRVIEGDSMPNINPIVDLYNAISLKY
ncbi:MAG: hypothetical protein Q9M76_05005, partial [Candidatus Dojkabacteria bacterium]|nr:hypothetical protein [Candidatus Dojkabacteria bacterium]